MSRCFLLYSVVRFQRFNALPFVLPFLLATTACRTPPAGPHLERFTFNSPHMGTLFTISLYATNKTSAEIAADAAFHRIETLDEIMSDYRADSELMRLCDQPFGAPVLISKELFDVLS